MRTSVWLGNAKGSHIHFCTVNATLDIVNSYSFCKYLSKWFLEIHCPLQLCLVCKLLSFIMGAAAVAGLQAETICEPNAAVVCFCEIQLRLFLADQDRIHSARKVVLTGRTCWERIRNIFVKQSEMDSARTSRKSRLCRNW